MPCPDVDEEDHQRTEYGRRQSGCPIANSARGFIRQHGAPVVQRWLLQPRLTEENRRHPVVAFEHLASNLGVAWLVDPDKADDPEADKKEKSAERDERY